MFTLSLGDTVTPDGIKVPSEYPEINLVMTVGPPKTKPLQPMETTQIKYRKILKIVMVFYLLYTLNTGDKEIIQREP